MRTGKTDRKAKKSVTLSLDSVAFLESVRRKQQAASISAVLEDMVQNVRREHDRQKLDKGVSEYYSRLSKTEAAELAQWGEFAERQFPSPRTGEPD